MSQISSWIFIETSSKHISFVLNFVPIFYIFKIVQIFSKALCSAFYSLFLSYINHKQPTRT